MISGSAQVLAVLALSKLFNPSKPQFHSSKKCHMEPTSKTAVQIKWANEVLGTILRMQLSVCKLVLTLVCGHQSTELVLNVRYVQLNSSCPMFFLISQSLLMNNTIIFTIIPVLILLCSWPCIQSGSKFLFSSVLWYSPSFLPFLPWLWLCSCLTVPGHCTPGFPACFLWSAWKAPWQHGLTWKEK